MGMALPRYIHPDPRDYFYLTLKPGIETTPTPTAMADMSSADLPHAGWPPAFARHVAAEGRRAAHRSDARHARVARGRPGASRCSPSCAARRSQPQPRRPRPVRSQAARGRSLHHRGAARRRAAAAQRTEYRQGARGPCRYSASMQAACSLYAESESKSPGQVARLLKEAGALTAIALPDTLRLGLCFREGVLALDGSVAAARGRGRAALRRADGAGRRAAVSRHQAHALFALGAASGPARSLLPHRRPEQQGPPGRARAGQGSDPRSCAVAHHSGEKRSKSWACTLDPGFERCVDCSLPTLTLTPIRACSYDTALRVPPPPCAAGVIERPPILEPLTRAGL